MKVFVITFGDLLAGSTQYRIAQYRNYFQEQGITLQCVPKKELNDSHLDEIAASDCLINQKSLLPLNFSRKILKRSKRIIFDYDDAIYTRPGKPFSFFTRLRVKWRLHYWLKHADIVTAANHVLRIYAEKNGGRVEVLPMTLDLDIWKAKDREDKSSVTMGWAGAPANLHHIERLEPILKTLLARYPNLKLIIYSGKKPSLDCPFEYTPFEEGTEHLFTQKLDIGLLPLTNDEFSKGKSPIKAIQYLACGVPVVGNVDGATAEILNGHNSIAVTRRNEWIQAIQRLIESPQVRKQMGQCGREHVLKNNNYKLVKNQWMSILRGSDVTSE